VGIQACVREHAPPHSAGIISSVIGGTWGKEIALLPHEEPLLTDHQLREASLEQLEDLVQRINLALQARGMPGLVWRRTPEDQPIASDPADPGAL
jgi:hypothetical protein